ncbi:MAG: hypothetical protein IJI87_09640 [Mogibacterium sp.]|nr:hypothetical protein [Mogibacterium sp.]
MDRNKQDIRYEELYNRLLERGMALHENNKKRIRAGLIFLAVFTVLMILIRLITDSDRVVFLILWVVGMFAASIYLISVEYIDNSIQKTLEEVSDREADFGELLPDSGEVREKVQSRIQEKQEEIQTRYKKHLRGKAPESEGEK